MNTDTQDQHDFAAADLDWENGEPVSRVFDDVYFSKAGGLQETEYVFLENNQLRTRWQSLEQDYFSIAETGFGTGLNFLCAVELWLKTAPPRARLDFLSYEKFPLTREQVEQALVHFPSLSHISQPLLEHYPELVKGFHRIHLFDQRVSLTLAFGDINELIPETRARIDAWFLDGFAPAKNPQMWSETLFSHMARLSYEHTSFATFTAAGIVKRGLKEVGFEVEKRKGFGHKRDMLAGHFRQAQAETFRYKDKPWFLKTASPIRGQRVVIIGAGLAGCRTADVLLRRGFKVTLIERHNELAQQASGNRMGVIYGKLSPRDSAQYRFHETAYLHSLSLLPELMQANHQSHWDNCGVLHLAHNDKEKTLHEAIIDSGKWPSALVNELSAEQASEIAGTNITCPALHFPKGGWIWPQALCQASLEQHDDQLSLLKDESAIAIEECGDYWKIKTDQQTLEADYVVISNAFDALEFTQTNTLPLKQIRGQVSHVPASEASSKLKQVICHTGYVTPAHQNEHAIGATFNLKDTETALRAEDHAYNFKQLTQHLPEFASTLALEQHPLNEGRVGFRCQTPDYLPVIGPVANREGYIQRFINLAKGFKHAEFQAGAYYPGLYINIAHGSRGITTSSLGAEIIADYICNTPAPVDQSVLNAIHPARFIVRDIKRSA